MKRINIAVALLAIAGLGSDAAADEISASLIAPEATTGLFASFGVGVVPAGVVGPGIASGELLQAGGALRSQSVEARLSVLVAFESTYYQSSTSALILERTARYVGNHFSFGGGLGLGFGSFSPTGDYNADNGTSFEVAFITTPVMVHLGTRNQFELGVDVGLLYLASFSEWDPFYQVSVGIVHW